MGDEVVKTAEESSYYKIMFDRPIPTGISDEQWY